MSLSRITKSTFTYEH